MNPALLKRGLVLIAVTVLFGASGLPAPAAAPDRKASGSSVVYPPTAAPKATRDLLAGVAPSFGIVKSGADLTWQDKLELSQGDVDRIRTWEMPPTYAIKKRYLFQVGDASAFIALSLNKSPTASSWSLNGQPIPRPLAEQKYATVPGIPLSLLQPGTNELLGIWTRDELQRFCYQREKMPPAAVRKALETDLQKTELLGMAPEALAFQSGPVLGFAGTNFLTLACRLNLPVAVTLRMDGRTFESPSGFFHRFKVEGLKPDSAYHYTLSAICSNRAAPLLKGPFRTRTLPAGSELKFAALGDSRSYPKIWGRVAKALARQRPMFTIHTGDIVADGLEDPQWDLQCFEPAAQLFASVPTFAVAGNHEHNSQVYYQMFSVPDGATNWVLEVGPILFVGVNDASSNSVVWMDSVLAASQAKFIFMVCHYPIMSSSDRSPPVMRKAFLPVLTKYQATAEIAGHDHYYERSELPEGLTVIVTGGAGADLYKKKQKPDKTPVNPYSRAYLSDYHFCVFSVKGDTCSMEAMTLNGKIFDRRAWPERQRTTAEVSQSRATTIVGPVPRPGGVRH